MKRIIRQRCGYGCVICGKPIYEYEHMEEWSRVHRHVAEEITLLCGSHHRERTRELLPIEVVRDADKNPINRRVGASSAQPLYYAGESCTISIAGSDFIAGELSEAQFLVPIVIDLLPIVMFRRESANLLLSLNAFNSDNTLALIIKDNELRYSTEPWDIEFVGNRLTIRQARGEFLLDVVFDAPNRIDIKRGLLAFNGVEIELGEQGMFIRNNAGLFRNTFSSGARAGIVIGEQEPKGLAANVRMAHVPRFLSTPPFGSDQPTSDPLHDAELGYFVPLRNWSERSNEHLANVRVRLDGFNWRDCRFDNCKLEIAGSKDAFGLENCDIHGGQWVFVEGAEQTMLAIANVFRNGTSVERQAVEALFDGVRDGSNLRYCLGRIGAPTLRTTAAYYTACVLRSLYVGLGPGGTKLVEGWFKQLRGDR